MGGVLWRGEVYENITCVRTSVAGSGGTVVLLVLGKCSAGQKVRLTSILTQSAFIATKGLFLWLLTKYFKGVGLSYVDHYGIKMGLNASTLSIAISFSSLFKY